MEQITTASLFEGWRLTCADTASVEGGGSLLTFDVKRLGNKSICSSQSYFAIRGRISGLGRSYVARLVLTSEDWKRTETTLLISRQGRIFEMVQLSSRVVEAQLVFHSTAPVAASFVLDISPLSRAGYRARQLHRVARVLRRPQLAHIRAVGTSWRQLVSVDALYKLASRFRANVFTYSYDEWFKEFYSVTIAERTKIIQICQRWKHLTKFSIYIDGRGSSRADVMATRESLQRQLYTRFEISVVENDVDDPVLLSTANTRRAADEDQWFFLIPAGCLFEEFTLFWFAHEIARSPNCRLVYCDHDTWSIGSSLANPVFKPDFSTELLRSENYIGHAYCWRSSNLDVRPTTHQLLANYARLLRLADRGETGGVIHIPACLMHIPEQVPSTNQAEDDAALLKHFAETGLAASVERTVGGRRRVRYQIPVNAPLVSIIIPTRNGLGHLKPCVESVIEKTSYHPFEIIIVDNQSDDTETLAYLDELRGLPGVSVVLFDEPFNYSRLNNFAVRRARGEWICLLNNDTEVISTDWLDDMAGYLSQSDVGVVGAKLLYSDGTVQHGGDAVGPGGCADHFHSGIGGNDPGYTGRALLAQDLSAVTAACLLTKSSLFRKLGGLDEVNLPVAFNDVDYCLRAREAGMRVVWTPHALLYHHESVSRGKDISPVQIRRGASEVAFMQTRWRSVMKHDPFYNPNLSYLRPDFSLSASPRVARPWSQLGVRAVEYP